MVKLTSSTMVRNAVKKSHGLIFFCAVIFLRGVFFSITPYFPQDDDMHDQAYVLYIRDNFLLNLCI